MKRPWLLTQTGKKAALHFANLLSLALFLAFVSHFALVEQPRTKVPQLDTANVTYCEITACEEIFGVQVVDGATAQARSEQTPIGVQLEIELSNTTRFEGKRQLWLRMETTQGEFIEAASTWVEFSLKNRTIAEFLITGTKAEIEASKIYLGY